MVNEKTAVDVMNENYTLICPKCGSLNACCIERSSNNLNYMPYYHMVCNNCHYHEWTSFKDLPNRWGEVPKSHTEKPIEDDIFKKTIIKQRVVRTRIIEHPHHMESLVTSLNAGWKVVMCNPIGDELEYILEKECEE